MARIELAETGKDGLLEVTWTQVSNDKINGGQGGPDSFKYQQLEW